MRTALTRLVALSLLAGLTGCASHDRAGGDTTGAGGPPAHDYVLVTLRRGPQAPTRSAEERTQIQAQHLANIGRLAEERTLVVAGPYGDERSDPEARGIFIFDVPTVSDATALTNTDPAVIAGALALTPEPLRTNADLRAALEAHLARDEASKRAGTPRPMGADIRPYVLVRAADGEAAERTLRAACPPDAIVLDGRTAGGAGFFVLDARETAAVRTWLASAAEITRDWTLDLWYATDLLVLARVSPTRALSSGGPERAASDLAPLAPSAPRHDPARHTGHGAPPLPNRVPAGKSSENA